MNVDIWQWREMFHIECVKRHIQANCHRGDHDILELNSVTEVKKRVFSHRPKIICCGRMLKQETIEKADDLLLFRFISRTFHYFHPYNRH